jgi:hypothetical protein
MPSDPGQHQDPDHGQIIAVIEQTGTDEMYNADLAETHAQSRQADPRPQKNADDTHLREVAPHTVAGDLPVTHPNPRGREAGDGAETHLQKVIVTARGSDDEEVPLLEAPMTTVAQEDVGQAHRKTGARQGVKAQAAAGATAPLPPQPLEHVNRQLMLWKVNASPLTERGLRTRARLPLRWVRHETA